MKTRKSWREKMEGSTAKVVTVPPKMQKRFGSKMLIPAALDIEALMRKVPSGKLVTQTEIRKKLAGDAGVPEACPITTGIFVRIIAEAAAEEMKAGKARVTPYWRLIRDDGTFIEKLPGGPTEMAKHLEAEGHSIDRSGKLRVKNFESGLKKF